MLLGTMVLSYLPPHIHLPFFFPAQGSVRNTLHTSYIQSPVFLPQAGHGPRHNSLFVPIFSHITPCLSPEQGPEPGASNLHTSPKRPVQRPVLLPQSGHAARHNGPFVPSTSHTSPLFFPAQGSVRSTLHASYIQSPVFLPQAGHGPRHNSPDVPIF